MPSHPSAPPPRGAAARPRPAAPDAPPGAPLGVILSGGRGLRMGGRDKALVPLGGQPLLAHVADRLTPQVPALALSANGDPARFADFGLPVLPDACPEPGSAGPLAGVLAGLDWAAARGAPAIVTVAADTPFLPHDLVARLVAAASGMETPLAVAATEGEEPGSRRRHPTCALWPVALREDLRASLAGGLRKVGLWADRHGARTALYSSRGGDPFFNVNTATDLAAAEALL